MNKADKLNLSIFFFLLIMLIIWIRFNLDFMRPILESSNLFFQLMLAVLVIAVIRNIIGIKTYGVFGPAIIIFGILKSGLGLFMGFTVFFNIFLIAMILSIILYPLKISSSYRVAIIISSLVAVVTLFELIGELFHLKIFEGVIFFPLLITSWFADRFVVQVKEIDWIETSKKLFGTIFTIFFVYVIITQEFLISFISITPELWLVLICLNFVFSLKSDFRFFDNYRFKDLFEKFSGKTEVLSLNVRNREYISKYNPVQFFSNLNKDEMKLTFHQLGIPTPETFLLISNKSDLPMLMDAIADKNSFVIKPTKGLGGEGIMIVDSKTNKLYNGSDEISFESVENHIKQILEGQYSNDADDRAIIEEKIVVEKKYSKYFYKGVFDIRVIVFCGFPVMAMMRIPTKESKGLANIHKGAITVGIKISDGKCFNPLWKSHGGQLKTHPDTKFDLTKLKISNWDEILGLACQAQGASKLNYVGVDVAISNKGPLVLEVNKRPGIEIQNANEAGLLKRLEFIETRLNSIKFLGIKDRVSLAKKYDVKKWS